MWNQIIKQRKWSVLRVKLPSHREIRNAEIRGQQDETETSTWMKWSRICGEASKQKLGVRATKYHATEASYQFREMVIECGDKVEMWKHLLHLGESSAPYDLNIQWLLSGKCQVSSENPHNNDHKEKNRTHVTSLADVNSEWWEWRGYWQALQEWEQKSKFFKSGELKK